MQEYDKAKTVAEKIDRQEAIEQYLITFPLRIACFISIEDKLYKNNVRFYEEYVIPQLLMEWIQQSPIYDGITYQSASAISEVNKRRSYNVAITPKDIDPTDGYDVKLKKYFKLSCPEKIDLSEKIKRIESESNEVFKYVKELEGLILMFNASERHPYYHLLAICYSFFSICSELQHKNNPNVEISFQQLIGLCHTALIINKTVENTQTADKWVVLYKGYKGDAALTPNDYHDVLLGFQTVNSAFQSLRSTLYPVLINKYIFINPDYEFI